MNALPMTAPVDMVAPPGAEMGMGIANAVLVLVCLGVAVYHWRRDGSPIGIWFLLGGALCTLNEPIVDVLGKVWFPSKGSTSFVTAWGVSIPAYMLAVYCWYVGGQAYLAYRTFKRGISQRGLYGLYAAYAVVNVFLEVPAQWLFGLYSYYGHQPFVLLGFPLWWTICNALMPLVMAGLVFRLEPHLPGWRMALIVPIAWMAAAATNGCIAAPTWLALNLENTTPWITHAAALVSLAFGLMTCHGLGLLVAKQEPKRRVAALRPSSG